MKKIILLPLDERPCNTLYPKNMFSLKDVHLVMPQMDIMGQKKTPGNLDLLSQFLIEESKDAYGLVVSIDTLLYGGIVPSRLHNDQEETLIKRLDVLREIKKEYPQLKIFAFDLIMRCPQYSSNDEEPDYYELCGREIFRLGFLSHKKQLNLISSSELEELNHISIPQKYLDDYLSRRDLNLKMNLQTIKLVKDQVIDFLIIPQDDAAQYGHTAKNQEIIDQEIKSLNLSTRIYMYPGADEVANTLISRMLCEIKQIKPKFFITYPSITSGHVIPKLEDRFLDTTVKYQIRAAGGMTVSSINESDLVIFVNASATEMASSAYIYEKRDQGFTTHRNMVDFVELMKDVIKIYQKPIVVADVAALNGSDHELMQLMQQKNILLDLAAYAGWNTSSNTLGTCIPQGIIYHVYGKTREHMDFLMSRYVEDYGYMSYVRTEMNRKLKDLGLNYFDVKEKHETVAKEIQQMLNQFIDTHLSSVADHIDLEDVWMPWKRMFEVGVTVKYIK